MGKDAFAQDDGVTRDLDQFVVDLDFHLLGGQRRIGQPRDEFGGVLGAGRELRVQPALDQGVAEYSATSLSRVRSCSVNEPLMPAARSWLSTWIAR